MIRCPVHDEVHEEGEPCPRLGHGAELGYSAAPNGDCEMHRLPKVHEKKRVLADGGKWDENRNQAVAS
jgi:hypothetical protein